MPRADSVPRFSVGTFVGRGQAVDQLLDLFEGSARLVTLTGPEGIGKSSVALRFATLHEHRFSQNGRGGAVLCDLSDTTSADDVVPRVTQALEIDLSGSPGIDTTLAIGKVLKERGPLLLILDQADAVAADLKRLLPSWLKAAPEVRLLVTSRAGLALPNEVRVKLGPLRTPPKGVKDVAGLLAFEAVELFVERAREVVRGWTLMPDDAPAVAEIVRRVGGAPLAVRLAAARLQAFSAGELLELLPRRVELLRPVEEASSPAGPSPRRAPPTAKSGRVAGTIEWSWRLLKPWEQTALAQSAVFRGGFHLEAAESVLDLSDHADAPTIPRALQALREKSLLRRVEALAPGGARYTHFAPIRDFAEEQLRRLALMARMRNRHAAYFLRVATELAEQVDTHGGVSRRRELEQERENLLAVVRWSLASEPLSLLHVERSLSGLLALEPVLAVRGPFTVQLALLDLTLNAAESLAVNPRLHARALESRGRARRVRGLMRESLEDLERALALARAAGDSLWEARALANIGTHHLLTGELELAEACYAEALPRMRREKARLLEGRCMAFLGRLHKQRGDGRSAQRCLEDAIEVHRSVGDRRFEGITLGDLAALHVERGEVRQGVGLLERALRIHREVGNRRFEGALLVELARVRFEQQRFEQAAELCEEALGIHREVLDRRGEGAARSLLGDVRLQLGMLDDARTEYDLAATLQQTGGDLASAALSLAKCACVEATQGALELARESLRDASELAMHHGPPELTEALALYEAHVHDVAALRGGRDGEERTNFESHLDPSTVPRGGLRPAAVRAAVLTVDALRKAAAKV
jgi:predicted ATPase